MKETQFLNLKKKFFMNTNNKILSLINHGFSGSLISELNENQINSLHKRLVESKKENKEAVTTNVQKITYSQEEAKGKSLTGNVTINPDMSVTVTKEDASVHMTSPKKLSEMWAKKLSDNIESVTPLN